MRERQLSPTTEAELAQAREKLARSVLTEDGFIAHLRRFAESKRWQVIVTSAGPAIRLVCARRDRIVFIGARPLNKLNVQQCNLIGEFREAGAETHHFAPDQVDEAEAVFD